LLIYAATTFLSAFLLFLVQPMIGKRILPWFGGTPAVWTTCLLFFQVALLGGYAYAHWISTRLTPRRQVVAHLLLLAVALPFLPIYPGPAFKPDDPGRPAERILLLLAMTTLVPYFALSATSPLLQRWFSLKRPGRSPYVLYALSNAGSLLALPAYVAIFEPTMSSQTHAMVWAAGYAAFAVLCGACAAGIWNFRQPCERRQPCEGLYEPRGALLRSRSQGLTPFLAAPAPRPFTRALWLLLPCGGSVLLLAVTNELCQDIMVVPFLWVLPLGAYLLSFILCFESDRWYRRWLFGPLAALLAAAIAGLMFEGVRAGFVAQAAIYVGGLFALCMVCHGELARLKPAPSRLTAFYLTVSAGGALGAVFVALIAPRIFDTYFELPLGLWGCCALGTAAAWHERRLRRPEERRRRDWLGFAPVIVALAILGVALGAAALQSDRADIAVLRNFYGVLRIKEVPLSSNSDFTIRVLQHGGTFHGWQLSWAPEAATAYYGVSSGVGLVLRHYPRLPGISVGVIGLGVGTVATYGLKGDTFRFYEINQAVADAAVKEFRYLALTRARWDIVLGDARLSLERDNEQRFDVLVLDAFSGDAIPVHLLTREAFDIYLQRLKPGGVIAVNISNNYLDLEPVLRAEAERAGLRACAVESHRDEQRITCKALWVLMSDPRSQSDISDADFLNRPEIRRAARPLSPRQSILWTDDFNNLFRILKWR